MKDLIVYSLLIWDLIYGIQFCGDRVNKGNSGALTQLVKEDIENSKFIGMNENEIIQKFGKNYHDRLSFDPPMPKLLFGREVLVTRLIFYSFIKGKDKDYGNMKISYSDEKIFLTFFFYKGKVVEYVIDHSYYDEEKEEGGLGDLDRYSGNYETGMRKVWTDSLCDRMYYERIVKKIHFPNKAWRKKYWDRNKCYWESDEDYANRNFGDQDYTE